MFTFSQHFFLEISPKRKGLAIIYKNALSQGDCGCVNQPWHCRYDKNLTKKVVADRIMTIIITIDQFFTRFLEISPKRKGLGIIYKSGISQGYRGCGNQPWHCRYNKNLARKIGAN